ncbi:hypothetical protein [Serratia phage SP1]|nr:hypothetical protein [Serratia phage SP1]
MSVFFDYQTIRFLNKKDYLVDVQAPWIHALIGDHMEFIIVKRDDRWKEPVIFLVDGKIVDVGNHGMVVFTEDDIDNGFIEVVDNPLNEKLVKAAVAEEVKLAHEQQQAAADKINFMLGLI